MYQDDANNFLKLLYRQLYCPGFIYKYFVYENKKKFDTCQFCEAQMTLYAT